MAGNDKLSQKNINIFLIHILYSCPLVSWIPPISALWHVLKFPMVHSQFSGMQYKATGFSFCLDNWIFLRQILSLETDMHSFGKSSVCKIQFNTNFNIWSYARQASIYHVLVSVTILVDLALLPDYYCSLISLSTLFFVPHRKHIWNISKKPNHCRISISQNSLLNDNLDMTRSHDTGCFRIRGTYSSWRKYSFFCMLTLQDLRTIIVLKNDFFSVLTSG